MKNISQYLNINKKNEQDKCTLMLCILLLFSGGIANEYWLDIPEGMDMWPIEYKKYCYKNCKFRLFSITCYKIRKDC
jgi:hypothetical protein